MPSNPDLLHQRCTVHGIRLHGGRAQGYGESLGALGRGLARPQASALHILNAEDFTG